MQRLCLISGLFLSSLLAADKTKVDISATQTWTDSGIDLKAGEMISIVADGTIQPDATHSTGPDGLARTWTDLMMQYPVANSGKGALIGRFTDDPAARPFFIGSSLQRSVPISGRLFLGINEQAGSSGLGSFHVKVQVTESQSAPAKVLWQEPPVTPQMLASVPPRVSDALGNLGDRVNFMIVGSREKVQKALDEAGWVVVDKTKKAAVLHGLLTSLSKEGYVTMPMSELELFGRVQDFGYAQADPLMVVESRHHFRIWLCPFTDGDEPVWAGAGTHDIGFDKDNRNNGITHKIDPNTDVERNYIGKSLADTGLTAKEDYVTASNTVREARTATGSSFTSDGRTLVIYLQP